MHKIPRRWKVKIREISDYFENVTVKQLEVEFWERCDSITNLPLRWKYTWVGGMMDKHYREMMDKNGV